MRGGLAVGLGGTLRVVVRNVHDLHDGLLFTTARVCCID